MISVLSKRADFLSANRGLRIARPGFVLLVNPNSAEQVRYGITVTKKIGNAVVRNRMKRRFRELLREALPTSGLPAHDHVLIGREGKEIGRIRGSAEWDSQDVIEYMYKIKAEHG